MTTKPDHAKAKEDAEWLIDYHEDFQELNLARAYLDLVKQHGELVKCVENLANQLRAAIIRCREEGVSSPALEFVCSKLEIDAQETLGRIRSLDG